MTVLRRPPPSPYVWIRREPVAIKAYREEREKWQREKDDILRRRCANNPPNNPSSVVDQRPRWGLVFADVEK